MHESSRPTAPLRTASALLAVCKYAQATGAAQHRHPCAAQRSRGGRTSGQPRRASMSRTASRVLRNAAAVLRSEAIDLRQEAV